MKQLNIESYPLNLIGQILCEGDNPRNLPTDYKEGLEYALSLCDDIESEMVRLHYRDGLTYREIGERYGLPPTRVKQIIDYAFRKLRHPRRARYIVYGYSEGKRRAAEKADQEICTAPTPLPSAKPLFRQGALIYDAKMQRMDIRFNLNDYYGGLHCGQCLEVYADNHWRTTRIEKGEGWYLVNVPTKSLIGLRVRIQL